MKRFVRNFGIVGLLIPVVLYPIWEWVNSGADLQSQINFDYFAMAVWPSSIFLMSLEGSGSAISSAIVVAISVVFNGIVYAGFGLLLWGVGRAWKRFAPGDPENGGPLSATLEQIKAMTAFIQRFGTPTKKPQQ